MTHRTPSTSHSFPDIHARANAALVGMSKELYVDVPAATDRLLGDLAGKLFKAEKTTAQKVALMTVLRLKQEAHAIRLLLGHGYPAQAMSLAANMIEITYELLFVGDDEVKAAQWEKHSEPGEKVWGKNSSIYKRMVDGLKSVDLSDADAKDQADVDYQSYGLLCDAKHGSPVINKVSGGFFDGDTFVTGPQIYQEKSDVFQAVQTSNVTAWMSVLAALAVIHYHLGDDDKAALLDESEKLNVLRKGAVLAVMAIAEADENSAGVEPLA